ncbi:hypothetical protein [Nocardioides massiliensis]|uniref:Uncharacterized protein n=1 Tax=Nocardioides massiliensis TaxID=1325935 RepID=A0ABT9NKA2_9ACTN|nr:hypothetical protein [Nocardioides massiliensis]MDP9820485.1 hypothetical protein [Nocardioides massiliensis]
MSDAIEHIDLDSDEYADTPRALRDAYKKLQDRLKDISSERDTLRTQMQASALSGVLTGFKNPERVKSALLSDKVDPLNTEAVTEWIEANGDDYAKASTEPGTQPAASGQPDPAAPYGQLRSLDGAAAGGDAYMTKLAQVQQLITADMDGAAVAALFEQHGL